VVVSFEHGKKPSDYIKFGDYDEAVMIWRGSDDYDEAMTIWRGSDDYDEAVIIWRRKIWSTSFVVSQAHVSKINNCRKHQQIAVKLQVTVTLNMQIANLPCVTPWI
jgi:hypothetical protein